jgi:glycine cleavage system H protein
MPSGLYYMLGHAWLRLEDGKRGTIGVVFDFLKAVGKIVSVELPKVHDTLNQGEVCGKINDAEKFIHRIWSPAAGMIIEVNFMVAREPSLLRQDLYGQGWLFKIEPANLEEDLKGLILSK